MLQTYGAVRYAEKASFHALYHMKGKRLEMISVLEKDGAYIITIQDPTEEEHSLAMQAMDIFERSKQAKNEPVKEETFTDVCEEQPQEIAMEFYRDETVKAVRVKVWGNDGDVIINKVLRNNADTNYLVANYRANGNKVEVTKIDEREDPDDIRISDMLDFEGFEELASDIRTPFEQNG